MESPSRNIASSSSGISSTKSNQKLMEFQLQREKNRVKDLSNELHDTKEYIARLEQENAELRRNVCFRTDDLKKRKGLEEKNQLLNSENTKLNSRIIELEKNVDRLSKDYIQVSQNTVTAISAWKNTEIQWINKNHELTEKLEDNMRELQNAEISITELKSSYEESLKAFQAQENRIEWLTESKDQLESELQSKQEQINIMQSDLQHKTSLLFETQRQLEHETDRITSLEEEVAAFTSKLKEKENLFENLENSYDLIRKHLEGSKQETANAIVEIQQLKGDIVEYKKSIQRKKNEIEQLNSKITIDMENAQRQENHMLELQQKIFEISEQNKKKSSEITKLEFEISRLTGVIVTKEHGLSDVSYELKKQTKKNEDTQNENSKLALLVEKKNNELESIKTEFQKILLSSKQTESSLKATSDEVRLLNEQLSAECCIYKERLASNQQLNEELTVLLEDAKVRISELRLEKSSVCENEKILMNSICELKDVSYKYQEANILIEWERNIYYEAFLSVNEKIFIREKLNESIFKSFLEQGELQAVFYAKEVSALKNEISAFQKEILNLRSVIITLELSEEKANSLTGDVFDCLVASKFELQEFNLALGHESRRIYNQMIELKSKEEAFSLQLKTQKQNSETTEIALKGKVSEYKDEIYQWKNFSSIFGRYFEKFSYYMSDINDYFQEKHQIFVNLWHSEIKSLYHIQQCEELARNTIEQTVLNELKADMKGLKASNLLHAFTLDRKDDEYRTKITSLELKNYQLSLEKAANIQIHQRSLDESAHQIHKLNAELDAARAEFITYDDKIKKLNIDINKLKDSCKYELNRKIEYKTALSAAQKRIHLSEQYRSTEKNSAITTIRNLDESISFWIKSYSSIRQLYEKVCNAHSEPIISQPLEILVKLGKFRNFPASNQFSSKVLPADDITFIVDISKKRRIENRKSANVV